MAAETIVCRRCGAENAAGDQFCGSCGAFLEWEGESLEAEGVAAETAETAPGPPREPPPDLAPTPIAPPPVPGSPARPAPAGVTCHSCGRDNPTGRTFCQSCGTRLREAGLVAAPEPARPVGPAAVGPAPVRTREPAPPRSSGGLPGWLPVVVVLGVLAGVAAVAASTLLRAPSPPSGASAAPGTPPATLTPTLPPASPGDSGAPITPSTAGVALTMTGATASSVVGDRDLFQPGMAIDGDLTTCWQEGATDEAGEWIEVTFEPALLDYVAVYTGYQLSRDAYLANLRPKDVTVSVNGGTPLAFVLNDTELPQRVDVGDVSGATTVRITIVSTYDSQASAYPGSPFDDTAISEIRAFGTPGG